MSNPWSTLRLRQLIVTLCVVLGAVLAGFGCGAGPTKHDTGPRAKADSRKAPPGQYHIDLFKAEPREGTAVVILIDTSGSMEQPVRDRGGQMRPKHTIAHAALDQIMQQTAAWKKAHPQGNLQLAIYHFASSVVEDLPMGGFDLGKAQAAVNKIPKPGGGTAIGKALEAGFKALYRSGCVHKFIVCVTDGENTAGPPPDWVARHLHAQTGGEVELHFVAFDTSARQFRFLSEVNGHVVEAADGDQLRDQLTTIYEKRILVEKEEPLR